MFKTRLDIEKNANESSYIYIYRSRNYLKTGIVTTKSAENHKAAVQNQQAIVPHHQMVIDEL